MMKTPTATLTTADVSAIVGKIDDARHQMQTVIHNLQGSAIEDCSVYSTATPARAIEAILQLQALSDAVARLAHRQINQLYGVHQPD